ncbi:MAG: hypothetical protein EZS28_052889, partial [Streblomastix strix]
LFLQPKKELRDPKHPVTKLSEKVDQKLGKVSFWLLYIPEQEYLQKNKDELLRKKKEEEEVRRNKAALEMQRQEEERNIQNEERRRQQEDDSQYVNGMVRFSNIGVRDLPKKDILRKTDPYVLLRMGMAEKQTSVAKNTTNCDFKGETYELQYDPSKMKGKKEANIEVWDYDVTGFDSLVGAASVDILPYLNKQALVELYLQPKKKKEDGSQSTTNLALNQDQKLGKVTFWMLYTPF